jgi:hypothetical protein
MSVFHRQPLSCCTRRRPATKHRRIEEWKEDNSHVEQTFGTLSPEQEAVVTAVIGCGITVHRELGPGFKECIYHEAFRLELTSRGLPFESEKPILVKYRE